MEATKQTRPEKIREWVEREFSPRYVESVYQDMLDVATGTREGNAFEKAALVRLFSK